MPTLKEFHDIAKNREDVIFKLHRASKQGAYEEASEATESLLNYFAGQSDDRTRVENALCFSADFLQEQSGLTKAGAFLLDTSRSLSRRGNFPETQRVLGKKFNELFSREGSAENFLALIENVKARPLPSRIMMDEVCDALLRVCDKDIEPLIIGIRPPQRPTGETELRAVL